MKNNVIIEFDIDFEVKIYAESELIGTSGFHDTFSFPITNDCLLTLKKGTKKAMIKVYKEKENRIVVGYSTTGQLKATYKGEVAKEQQEQIIEQKEEPKVVKAEQVNHQPEKEKTKANPTEENNTAGVIGAICTIALVFFWVKSCVSNTGGESYKYIEGGTIAENAALRDIPDDSYVLFDTVMESELQCKADSKTEDAIVLVKCTTTHEDIIKRFGKTVWYGYQSSADGTRYRHKTASSKEEVLNAFRK